MKGFTPSLSDQAQRFWERVRKTKKCWIWIGSKATRGYGRFTYKNKPYSAHRFSWFLKYGKYPENLLLHTCDNPPCVNPNHLIEGTQLDNIKDSIKKGRFRKK